MKTGLPWLPAGVLGDERAARPFAVAISAWSARWFARSRWTAASCFEVAANADWSLLHDGAAFQLFGKPKALVELAFAILGQPPRPGLTDTDMRYLRRLGSRALDDLAAGIEPIAVLGSGAAPMHAAAEPLWQLDIGRPRQPSLAIIVAQSTLVAAARKSYPAVRPSAALARPRDAVADVAVSLAGRVGSARLAVGQIGSLEVGDLLLLDTSAERPLELAVAGRPSNLFFAIDSNSDRLTLTMQD